MRLLVVEDEEVAAAMKRFETSNPALGKLKINATAGRCSSASHFSLSNQTLL